MKNNYQPNRDLVDKGKYGTLKKECIFCNKNKYKKKVLEKLMQSLEFFAVELIKKPQQVKNDFMLSLLVHNLIDLEGHYHKSCYREYTQKIENLSTSSNESQYSSGTNLY